MCFMSNFLSIISSNPPSVFLWSSKHLKVKVAQKNEDPVHDLDVEIGNMLPKPSPGSITPKCWSNKTAKFLYTFLGRCLSSNHG